MQPRSQHKRKRYCPAPTLTTSPGPSSVRNKRFLSESETHSDATSGVVFAGDDDGKRLVSSSSSRDGTVRVYTCRTEELEWQCKPLPPGDVRRGASYNHRSFTA